LVMQVIEQTPDAYEMEGHKVWYSTPTGDGWKVKVESCGHPACAFDKGTKRVFLYIRGSSKNLDTIPFMYVSGSPGDPKAEVILDLLRNAVQEFNSKLPKPRKAFCDGFQGEVLE